MKTLAALAIVAVLAVWFARRPALIEPLPNAADGAGGTETVQPEMARAPTSSGTVLSARGSGDQWQAAYFPASGGPPVVSDVMHGHGWAKGVHRAWPNCLWVDDDGNVVDTGKVCTDQPEVAR